MALKASLRAAYAATGPATQLGQGMRLADGTEIERVPVSPMVAAYRRMVRTLEFDICELAPVTYMLARASGLPVKAIPVFLSRKFHYADVVVRNGTGIREPKDVEGKRFGVRAYSVTTAVWVREFLARDFDVDLSRVTWVVDDEDHVQGIEMPGNVERLAGEASIADEFRAGRIQVAAAGAAGIGRKGAPRENWMSAEGLPTEDEVAHGPLVPDSAGMAAASYKESGVYPMHKLIVLKDDVVERHPELPGLLFDEFERAKSEFAAGPKSDDEAQRYADLAGLVDGDPYPYGLEANRPSLEALTSRLRAEKWLPPEVTVDTLFYDINP